MSSLPAILDETPMTLGQVAAKLRIKLRTVYAWCKSKRLESIKVGSRIRTSEQAVARMLELDNAESKVKKIVSPTKLRANADEGLKRLGLTV